MSERIEDEELQRIVENRMLPTDGNDVIKLAKNVLAARNEVRNENKGIRAIAGRVIAFASQLEAWGYNEVAHQLLEEIIGTAQVNAPDYYALRQRIAELEADNGVMENRIEALEVGLQKVVNWSDAYPLEMFPEPDMKKAREVLKAGGIIIDEVTVYAMRHVVEGVGKIARTALKEPPQ